MIEIKISDRNLDEYLPKGKGKALDVGCGPCQYKSMIEAKGYEWHGIDLEPGKGGIKADMHKIPFPDSHFDLVFCRAVLEYSPEPDILLKEIKRVLKNKGFLVGCVAFLEPWHHSYFHYTHSGLNYILEKHGFKIELIHSSNNWNGIRAIARMSLFPRIPKIIIEIILMPILLLSKFYWAIGRLKNKNATKERLIRDISGTFIFVANKTK